MGLLEIFPKNHTIIIAENLFMSSSCAIIIESHPSLNPGSLHKGSQRAGEPLLSDFKSFDQF